MWFGANPLIFNFRDFLSLSKEVTKALKHAGYLPDINGETSTWATPTTNHNNHQVKTLLCLSDVLLLLQLDTGLSKIKALHLKMIQQNQISVNVIRHTLTLVFKVDRLRYEWKINIGIDQSRDGNMKK